MIKLVAFDLDGTLADTIPFTLEAFKKAVAPYTAHDLNDETIMKTFGLNEKGMIKAVVDDHYEEALTDFYHLYDHLHEQCAEPFHGIPEILQALQTKEIKIALITGKGQKAADITLEKLKIGAFFDDIETGLEDRPNKAQALEKLIRKYQLAKNEMIYVGDAVSDVHEARKAGVVCLSAAWKKPSERTELAKINPDYLMASTEQLYDYLIKRIN